MARASINLPAHFPFATEIQVRVTDLNYGNHLGNDALLGLLHEARVQFYKSYGYSEINLEGFGTIMTDCVLLFKGEAFLGDVLKIEVAVGEFNKYGFDVFYKVTEKHSVKWIAQAKTGICCFDYVTRKLVSLPAEVISRFSTQ